MVFKIPLDKPVTFKLRCHECGTTFEKTFKERRVGTWADFCCRCPNCRRFIHIAIDRHEPSGYFTYPPGELLEVT